MLSLEEVSEGRAQGSPAQGRRFGHQGTWHRRIPASARPQRAEPPRPGLYPPKISRGSAFRYPARLSTEKRRSERPLRSCARLAAVRSIGALDHQSQTGACTRQRERQGSQHKPHASGRDPQQSGPESLVGAEPCRTRCSSLHREAAAGKALCPRRWGPQSRRSARAPGGSGLESP